MTKTPTDFVGPLQQPTVSFLRTRSAIWRQDRYSVAQWRRYYVVPLRQGLVVPLSMCSAEGKSCHFEMRQTAWTEPTARKNCSRLSTMSRLIRCIAAQSAAIAPMFAATAVAVAMLASDQIGAAAAPTADFDFAVRRWT